MDVCMYVCLSVQIPHDVDQNRQLLTIYSSRLWCFTFHFILIHQELSGPPKVEAWPGGVVPPGNMIKPWRHFHAPGRRLARKRFMPCKF